MRYLFSQINSPVVYNTSEICEIPSSQDIRPFSSVSISPYSYVTKIGKLVIFQHYLLVTNESKAGGTVYSPYVLKIKDNYKQDFKPKGYGYVALSIKSSIFEASSSCPSALVSTLGGIFISLNGGNYLSGSNKELYIAGSYITD